MSLAFSQKVKMGDAEEQEVQEGPVENAWALKVFLSKMVNLRIMQFLSGA